jgi:serine/threonine-protein kinase
MIQCPACSCDAPAHSRFCPGCGSPLTASALPPTGPYQGGESTPRPATASQPRFPPGLTLAGRYRIVAAIGKGGMGEVYRADDLTLGQPVALKFLPRELADDPERLARFRNEVKVARQVSHPNVCRVYDIGQADGQHFLTMEYIDGENLASLLRRIGRLPEDKGVELARQLCLGLAAAHDKGVLHRDLKPHNVMIDGRGRVRLTDFGLAGFAGQIHGTEVRAGTPAYQAPEQLAGREVSVQSDLYALGLVLYEMFTGRRAFEGRAGAAGPHQGLTPPSGHVSGLSPAVERVILRCLEPEPRARPRSALAVVAGLPGGDPLAAALAAGETPSPEVVANAAEDGGLSPRLAAGLLAATVAGLALLAGLADWSKVFRRVPLEQPPEQLAFTARQLLARLGHPGPPVDSAWGLDNDFSQLRQVGGGPDGAASWAGLATGRPAVMYFWYLQSPSPLEATDRLNESGAVTPRHPPLSVPGMATVFLDLKGRLIEFAAVPEGRPGTAAVTSGPDWSPLFAAAGLDPGAFTPVAPDPVPHADTRAAWEGVYPDRPDLAVRVEAAAQGATPVAFRVVGPSTTGSRTAAPAPGGSQRAVTAMWFGMSLLVLTAGVLLARRNIRLGRADLKGSLRLALAVGAAELVSWAFRAHHVAALAVERYLGMVALGSAVATSGVLYVAYLAVEPFLRRRWSWRVISWNRLLDGRFRDPLVGRDLLIGAFAGVALGLLNSLHVLTALQLHVPLENPFVAINPRALSLPFLPAMLAWDLAAAVTSILTWFAFLFLAFLLCRREWLSVAVLFTAATALYVLQAGPGLTAVVFIGLRVGVCIFIGMRFGLLALTATYYSWLIVVFTPLTYDLSAWYAPSTVCYVLVLVAVAVHGFIAALAGRPLFRGGFLPDA